MTSSRSLQQSHVLVGPLLQQRPFWPIFVTSSTAPWSRSSSPAPFSTATSTASKVNRLRGKRPQPAGTSTSAATSSTFIHQRRGMSIQASQKWDENWQETAKASNVVLIDCRTPDEFAQKSIANSINISIRMPDDPVAVLSSEEALQKLKEKKVGKDTPIVVYCAVGGRSHRAAEALRALGYGGVKNGGGVDEVKMLVEGGGGGGGNA